MLRAEIKYVFKCNGKEGKSKTLAWMGWKDPDFSKFWKISSAGTLPLLSPIFEAVRPQSLMLVTFHTFALFRPEPLKKEGGNKEFMGYRGKSFRPGS